MVVDDQSIRLANIVEFESYMNLIPPTGLIMEFGVAQGNTIKVLASKTDRTVYGFDSFEGLPESWHIHDKGHFACDIPQGLGSNVVLIKGWYEDTLKPFLEEHKNEKVALMHIDCDLYSSTKCIFDVFENNFQNGSIILFDEIIDYGGDLWEQHEFKAFNEFLERTGYSAKCIGKHGVHQAGFILSK